MRLFRQRHPAGRIRDVSPDEAERAIRAGAVLLTYVKTREWAAGHAPGAVHLPLGQVADAVLVLPAGRGVVAVRRSANRSCVGPKRSPRAALTWSTWLAACGRGLAAAGPSWAMGHDPERWSDAGADRLAARVPHRGRPRCLLGGGGSILAVPALVYAAGQGARRRYDVPPRRRADRADRDGRPLASRPGTGRSGLVFGAVGIGGSLLGLPAEQRRGSRRAAARLRRAHGDRRLAHVGLQPHSAPPGRAGGCPAAGTDPRPERP